MARRPNNVTPFSRDYRRSSQWNMGLPPRKPKRSGWRLADPRFYLSAVMFVASVGLIILPAGTDAMIALARPAASGQSTCRIYQVIDGDTVRMWCPGRESTSARLTGFDTPELFSPSCARELAAAVKAKWALRLTIWNAGKITLVREGTDRYGRALVAAFVDGEPLARRMIKSGNARAYDGDVRQGWCA